MQNNDLVKRGGKFYVSCRDGIISGHGFNVNNIPTANQYSDLFKYNPINDTWDEICSDTSVSLYYPVNFVFGDELYLSKGTFTSTTTFYQGAYLKNINSFNYSWSTGDTTSSITVQPTQTTTYSVTVDDGISSCTDDVTITINNPQLSLADTLSQCGADSLLISADAGFSAYSWNTGATSQNIYAQNSGLYQLTATDTVGCTASDTTIDSINDPNIDKIDTNICIGDSMVMEVLYELNSCMPLPSNLQNGLVGYWPFCGNANDESGNGNDGAVNGASLTTDRFGNSNSAYDLTVFLIIFHVDIFCLDNKTELTFSVWLKGILVVTLKPD